MQVAKYSAKRCQQCNRICAALQVLNDAVISVYDKSDKLVEVHRHKGDFREP
jgi:hypothetical protein